MSSLFLFTVTQVFDEEFVNNLHFREHKQIQSLLLFVAASIK
jgi:hypothetical protein